MKQLTFDRNGNLGGIHCMYAIPLTSFKRIWHDATNHLDFLQVINRDDIIDIYLTENDGVFTETSERGIYKPEISGVVPKSNRLNQQNLTRLETEYWLVLFRDNNDQWRLSGNEENQLSFTRTDTSGQISSRNQLSFTFTGSQRIASRFIELAEIADL